MDIVHMVCVAECYPGSMTAIIFIRTALTAYKSLSRSGLTAESFVEERDGGRGLDSLAIYLYSVVPEMHIASRAGEVLLCIDYGRFTGGGGIFVHVEVRMLDSATVLGSPTLP